MQEKVQANDSIALFNLLEEAYKEGMPSDDTRNEIFRFISLNLNEIDFDSVNGVGDTFLHVAARAQDARMFVLFEDPEQDEKVKNIEGKTAEDYLEERTYKKIEKFRQKLDNTWKLRKDIGDIENIGKSALLNLIENGNFDFELQQTWSPDFTPFEEAIELKDLDILNALVKKGANPNALVNESGETALHQAAELGHYDTYDFLQKVDGINVDAQNIEGKRPVECLDYLEYLEYCVTKQKAEQDIVNFIKQNRPAIKEPYRIEYLDSSYSDSETESYESESSDVYSDSEESYETIDNYVDVKDLNKFLFIAFNSGYFELVKTLVEIGADFNAVNADGKTLLHLAAEEEKYEFFEYLRVDTYTDTEKLDNNGKRAFELLDAKRYGLYIYNPDKDLDNVIFSVGLKKEINDKKMKDEDIVELINNNKDKLCFAFKHSFEISLLHSAVFRGSSAVVQALVEAGAEVDCRLTGDTPLHWAANYYGGDPNVYDYLVSKGADENAIDELGDSAKARKEKSIQRYKELNKGLLGKLWDKICENKNYVLGVVATCALGLTIYKSDRAKTIISKNVIEGMLDALKSASEKIGLSR